MRLLALASATALAACGGSSVTSATSEDEDDEIEPPAQGCPEGCCRYDLSCPSVLVASIDVDGQIVPVDAVVTVTFEGREDLPDRVLCGWTAQDVAVSDVSGSILGDRGVPPAPGDPFGATLTFVPDAPLEPGVTYTAVASASYSCWPNAGNACSSHCSDELSVTFTTAE